MPAVDFKKTDKALYNPGAEPSLIEIPRMRFIMTDGKGDPNEEGGEFQSAVELLYGLSYGIKMNKANPPEGYFAYSVPPLEGLWWLEGGSMDFSQKDKFFWTAMIRQPDFVDEKVFARAREDLMRKKKLDSAKARLVTWEEGLCVQVMHIGSYDSEHESIAKILAFMEERSLADDIGEMRKHHEIYLSDFRKTSPDKLRTIIRHPARKI